MGDKNRKMIKIIGTTHFDSKNVIENIIKENKPDILGVELCGTRFKIFTNQTKDKGEKDETLLGKIADETKKKAEEENLDYGSDMKSVMFYAINNNIPLELVDKDIMEIRKEMEQIPLNEQLHLQKELVKFQKEKLKTEINEDEVIKEMKENIPTTYNILVKGRNDFIIKRLKEVNEKYKSKNILVFLGKGHVKEIQKEIEGGNK